MTVAALAACAATVTLSVALGPIISVSPNVGPPGTKVSVTGSGFGVTEVVDLTFDGNPLAKALSDGGGAFRKKAKIPVSATPGMHSIVATGETSGLTASAAFTARTDWPMFHFSLDRAGSNRFENVLGATTIGGTISALTASTGQVLWSTTTGGPIGSSPALANGVLYVGSDDNKVYALDEATGVVLWSYTTGGFAAASPAVADGVVYAGSFDGKLYAFGLPG